MIAIQEGNKIIAYFMGWSIVYIERPTTVIGSDRVVQEFIVKHHEKIYSRTPATWCTTKDETEKYVLYNLVNTEYGWAGKYSKSWNDLMPVIAKIKTLCMNDVAQNLLDHLDNGLIEIDIDVVFQRSVELIKWYNND